MINKKVIEFLFNGQKYRVERFIFLIIFWLVVLYLTTAFRVSLPVILVPVLMLALIMSVIKIMWYNKKQNIKTKVIDWIELVLCLIVLIVVLFLFFKENKLENAVHDVIKEKVENETFTIDFIDEVEYKEKYIVVGYTIKGEHAKYLEWYYWRDGELVQDLTRKIEDDNE
ncbi:hypothetical protein ACFSTA_08460 [Ornithinibacillus salinisoli]|uniref:Uncharacterized protein n=1 Tax=Ornithinibacillus salinisoli TaxID=1848459 RepID=A0ABW4W0P1_9BACI